MSNALTEPGAELSNSLLTAQGQGSSVFRMESNAPLSNEALSECSSSDRDRGTLAIPTPEGFTDEHWAATVKAYMVLDFESAPTPWRDPFPNVPPSHKIYFVGGKTGPVKIGFTQQPLEERLKCIQTGSPIRLRVLAVQHAPRQREKFYHRHFAKYRLHGEWFTRCPEIEAEIARLAPSPPQELTK